MSRDLATRPPRLEEAGAAAELLNEHSQRLYGKPDTTPENMRWFWDAPDVDPARDVFLAESANGELIGYADVAAWGDAVWLDVRAIDGTALGPLLEAAERRGLEKKPEGPLRGWAGEQDAEVRELFERAGYELIRHSFRMEIDLAGELPEPEWPEGIEVRTFRAGDERRLHAAHNAAFADTWAFVAEPYEEWEHYVVKNPSFDPELIFLAEAGDELAGYSVCRISDTEPDMGWVNLLGVLPAYRRRGLAIALLHHSFREFALRSFERAGLGVDAQNPTGAVRLYERAGMHVARTSVQYEKG